MKICDKFSPGPLEFEELGGDREPNIEAAGLSLLMKPRLKVLKMLLLKKICLYKEAAFQQASNFCSSSSRPSRKKGMARHFWQAPCSQ